MAKSGKKDFAPPPRPKRERLASLMRSPGSIEDLRQEAKVRYPVAQVILLVIAAIAGNARAWVDIGACSRAHARTLRRFLLIEAIPSHDTIERVVGMISPAVLARICQTWCDVMDFEAGTPESLKGLKLLNIDGKTVGGSAGRGR